MEEPTAKKGSSVLEIVKALITGIILSLILVLLAALVIKVFNIKTGAIPVINQFIKGVSILCGCLFAFKGKKNNWLRGILAGIIYIAVSFVIFSLLDGSFSFGLHIVNDVALGAVTGMLSGILSSLKK